MCLHTYVNYNIDNSCIHRRCAGLILQHGVCSLIVIVSNGNCLDTKKLNFDENAYWILLQSLALYTLNSCIVQMQRQVSVAYDLSFDAKFYLT